MIIDKYLYGWDHLEPVLLSCLARGFNVLLLGKHGCGKSSISKFFADAFSEETKAKFMRYAMDKENLVSMVGIPNVNDLKEGKITYATHERSIFNADVILFDEITRAPKDNQNMVLEALEEKTVFGMPLKYRFAIATANDETYKATFKLDPALLDRFVVVIPVPTTSGDASSVFTGAEELGELIRLNVLKRGGQVEDANRELIETIQKIRKTYKELFEKENILNNTIEYVSKFCAMLLSSLKNTKDIYVSPRQIGDHMTRLIISCAAYYKLKEYDDYLERGAVEAYRYSLGTKLGIPLETLTNIHSQIRDLLSDRDTEIESAKIRLTTGVLAERVKTLESTATLIKEHCEIDEQINILGNMINDVDLKNNEDIQHLVKFYRLIKENGLNKQCLNKALLMLHVHNLNNDKYNAVEGLRV